jgi:hypothetical protein
MLSSSSTDQKWNVDDTKEKRRPYSGRGARLRQNRATGGAFEMHRILRRTVRSDAQIVKSQISISFTTSQPFLLSYADRFAIRVSLTCRYPFLTWIANVL